MRLMRNGFPSDPATNRHESCGLGKSVAICPSFFGVFYSFIPSTCVECSRKDRYGEFSASKGVLANSYAYAQRLLWYRDSNVLAGS
jgi:hypothetical protein